MWSCQCLTFIDKSGCSRWQDLSWVFGRVPMTPQAAWLRALTRSRSRHWAWSSALKSCTLIVDSAQRHVGTCKLGVTVWGVHVIQAHDCADTVRIHKPRYSYVSPIIETSLDLQSIRFCTPGFNWADFRNGIRLEVTGVRSPDTRVRTPTPEYEPRHGTIMALSTQAPQHEWKSRVLCREVSGNTHCSIEHRPVTSVIVAC